MWVVITKKMNYFKTVCLVLLFCECEGETGVQTFRRKPESIFVVEGENVLLPCSVSLPPGPVQWTKDGFGLGIARSLPGYPRYTMAGTSDIYDWDLAIEEVGTDDDGLYQCQVGAGNTTGPVMSSMVTLTVLMEPEIPRILQGEELEVMEGREEVLECQSKGRPQPELTWQDENGQTLRGSQTEQALLLADGKTYLTSSVIHIIPRKSQDRQAISCSSFNSVSTKVKTSQVILRLIFMPVVTLVQTSKNVLEGDKMCFKCSVEAWPAITSIAWFLADKQLVEQTDNNLTLERVAREQQGVEVRCAARNKVGVGHATAQLNIIFGPTIHTHPSSLTAKEGEAVSFHCQAESNPPAEYSWMQDSTLLAMHSPTLSIVASRASSGSYTCLAQQAGAPAVTSYPATLQVITRPQIWGNKVGFGLVGGQAKIECRVVVVGEVTLRWERNGEPVSGEHEVTVTDNDLEKNSELLINILSASDFGEYVCLAENEVGKSYEVFTIQKQEYLFSSPIFITILSGSIVCIILLSAIIGLLLLRRKDKNAKTRVSKESAVPDRKKDAEMVMEDEHLLRDLHSTRIKGIDENFHAQQRFLHLLPPLPTPYDQASRRSSLLSSVQVLNTNRFSDDKILSPNYYCQTRRGPTHLSHTSSHRDSGVYSPSPSGIETGHLGRGRERLRTMENVGEDEIRLMIIRSRKRETCV